MVRPKMEQPTPAELEVLKVVWKQGECTVRDVMDSLQTDRAYTSVMSLLQVMTGKRLLKRKKRGRAFVYTACKGPKKTLGCILGDILKRGFEGSPGLLVSHLLEHSDPAEEELDAIRKALEEHKRKRR